MILETIETKHNGLFPPLWQISAPFQRCEKEVVSKSMILLGVAVQHGVAEVFMKNVLHCTMALHSWPLPTPRPGLMPHAPARSRDEERE